MRKLIILHFFRQWTPLHLSAYHDNLEICRLLVESKADVAARNRCFSPPPSHHLSLTICLAGGAKLLLKSLSTATKPTLLHTCAASARRNDAPPRAAAAPIKAVLVCVAAAVFFWGGEEEPPPSPPSYTIQTTAPCVRFAAAWRRQVALMGSFTAVNCFISRPPPQLHRSVKLIFKFNTYIFTIIIARSSLEAAQANQVVE